MVSRVDACLDPVVRGLILLHSLPPAGSTSPSLLAWLLGCGLSLYLRALDLRSGLPYVFIHCVVVVLLPAYDSATSLKMQPLGSRAMTEAAT